MSSTLQSKKSGIRTQGLHFLKLSPSSINIYNKVIFRVYLGVLLIYQEAMVVVVDGIITQGVEQVVMQQLVQAIM